MTTTPSTESLATLCLRSPDALLSAVPYLIGFTPAESGVLLWLRDGRILLTQRMDLPTTRRAHGPWVRQAWAHPAAVSSDELIAVFVSAAEPDARLVAALTDRAGRQGLDVRDVVWQNGDRWRSLLCADEACCPPAGRFLDPSTAAAVAAEFTVLGCAPVADRAALVAETAPDAERVLEVAAASVTVPATRGRSGGARRERWRDESIALLCSHLEEGGASSPGGAESARLLAGLGDIRVRDTLLWELAKLEDSALATAGDRLGDLLRAAPDGLVAPVATCCAVTAWLRGDGVRALAALDRAAADDAEYSLAALVAASLRAGLPPQTWRSAMADLTREECRHGRG